MSEWHHWTHPRDTTACCVDLEHWITAITAASGNQKSSCPCSLQRLLYFNSYLMAILCGCWLAKFSHMTSLSLPWKLRKQVSGFYIGSHIGNEFIRWEIAPNTGSVFRYAGLSKPSQGAPIKKKGFILSHSMFWFKFYFQFFWAQSYYNTKICQLFLKHSPLPCLSKTLLTNRWNWL